MGSIGSGMDRTGILILFLTPTYRAHSRTLPPRDNAGTNPNRFTMQSRQRYINWFEDLIQDVEGGEVNTQDIDMARLKTSFIDIGDGLEPELPGFFAEQILTRYQLFLQLDMGEMNRDRGIFIPSLGFGANPGLYSLLNNDPNLAGGVTLAINNIVADNAALVELIRNSGIPSHKALAGFVSKLGDVASVAKSAGDFIAETVGEEADRFGEAGRKYGFNGVLGYTATVVAAYYVISGLRVVGKGGSGARFLTPDGFRNLPPTGRIDPKMIRFSQNSVAPTFRKGKGSVRELAQGLRSGAIDPGKIKPIRIVGASGV